MTLRHRFVTAAGLRWHLVEAGEEGGDGQVPPIALLAGFPPELVCVAAVADHLLRLLATSFLHSEPMQQTQGKG